MHKLYISRYFSEMLKFEPIYAVAESHSESKIKNGKEVWAYSCLIVITNILATKKFRKEIVNKIIEDGKVDEKRRSNTLSTDKYNEYDVLTENALDSSV